jgi:hypothetical protein
LPGDGCDQHCVASQAVRRLEKLSLILAERPANGGLLRIGHQSPGSDFGHSRSEIADSLRRTFEKLPFLGDCGRRPGSICTAWPSLQCNSPNSPPWPPANLECPARAAAPSLRCSFAKFYALATGKLGTSTLHCRVRYNPFPSHGSGPRSDPLCAHHV